MIFHLNFKPMITQSSRKIKSSFEIRFSIYTQNAVCYLFPFCQKCFYISTSIIICKLVLQNEATKGHFLGSACTTKQIHFSSKLNLLHMASFCCYVAFTRLVHPIKLIIYDATKSVIV